MLNKLVARAVGTVRPGCRAGFSLLELLIALTILAIALVPVAYFYSKSLQTVEQASIRTRALTLARERIAEIRQMPYDQVRTNITPSSTQLKLYGGGPGGYSIMETDGASAADWYGYDFVNPGATAAHPALRWAGMFNYPLPLYFNPYIPEYTDRTGTASWSQGYNNSPGVNHGTPNNPTGTPYVNFFNPTSIDYEYEPIGFYTQQVYATNRTLLPVDRRDIRRSDRRTITGIEPSLDGGNDFFRTGSEQQVDNYAIYGRRTIILDVIPEAQDTDTDAYPPDSDWVGGASAANPYPASKGPDNKFQMVTRNLGRGKLVIVQVFWLPRNAPEAYIPARDLNKIELKTFISVNNRATELPTSTGELINNDYLFITQP